MICKNCGSYNPDSNFFCGRCGNSLQAREDDSRISNDSDAAVQVRSVPSEILESKAGEPAFNDAQDQEEPWKKYCVYCQFKDKLLPSGDSYCSVCELKAEDVSPPKPAEEIQATEEEPGKTGSEFLIPQGRRTSRLKARMREREAARAFYAKAPKTTIAAIGILFLVGAIVFYALRFQQNRQRQEASQKYLKTSETLIRDYNKVVRKIGQIGNEVYLPDAGTFEERRAKALADIDALIKETKEKYELAEETETGNPELEVLKSNLVGAYGNLLKIDIPELEDFVRTVDFTIIKAMMEGSFSKSSFDVAVGISREASAAMEEAIEQWHEEENELM